MNPQAARARRSGVPSTLTSQRRPGAAVRSGRLQRDQTCRTRTLPDQTLEETAVYAIVRAGSRQQKVAVGDVIEIDKTDAAVGDTLTLPVLMTVDGDKVTATGLDKAGVTVEVIGATKGPKIIIQKYKNKTGYKKRQGHRQKYTQVKVTEISA
jgi:large subunit ribosomal protein L21